jgi:hypothetical protein
MFGMVAVGMLVKNGLDDLSDPAAISGLFGSDVEFHGLFQFASVGSSQYRTSLASRKEEKLQSSSRAFRRKPLILPDLSLIFLFSYGLL